jgi:3-hydroxyisobutyrate dehydrogenase-like beta-hydroxyacid dehydrogenase
MNIGMIGCGIIGSRMGRNWQKAGHQVSGWNRTPANAKGAGFPLLDSPAAVAEASEVIMVVVADPPALRSVIEGVRGLARGSLKGKVVLNASTVGPADNQRAARQVQEAGGEFLEVPFTGSKGGAEAAKLVFYVGGDQELLARLQPVLLQIGQKCFHFGAVGTAADAKLVMNMMLANLMQAMIEGLVFSEKAGLDMDTFVEAYKMNAGYSVLADMKIGKMLAGDYSPHFSLKHMDKDVRIALERADELHAACPLTERLKGLFSEAMNAGWGEEDFAVLYRLISEKSTPR